MENHGKNHGIVFLNFCGNPDFAYVINNCVSLPSIFSQGVCSQKYILSMWATAFFIIENCSTDLKDGDFTTQILQVAQFLSKYFFKQEQHFFP